jgi:UPF0148 protein
MNNDLIKQGAYYLLRGGTLLSEPCKKCGNLQIKFKDDVICMNCQHSAHDETEKQETHVNDLVTREEVSRGGGEEDDKSALDISDIFLESLSQIEREVLQNLVQLSREQNATTSLKKYKRYLEIVQNSLKTIEMIRRIKLL